MTVSMYSGQHDSMYSEASNMTVSMYSGQHDSQYVQSAT